MDRARLPGLRGRGEKAAVTGTRTVAATVLSATGCCASVGALQPGHEWSLALESSPTAWANWMLVMLPTSGPSPRSRCCNFKHASFPRLYSAGMLLTLWTEGQFHLGTPCRHVDISHTSAGS